MAAASAQAPPNPELQAPPPDVPEAALFLPDWGLADGAGIRLGQLSLIHDSGGPRLAVYMLRDSLPPEFRGPTRGATPRFSGNNLVVARFASNRNRLGGYFSAFQRAPSAASATLARAPDGRRALRLSYRRGRRGYCGLWVHLFDFTLRPTERVYLDARPFSILSFWIRGERGGERLLLKLADAEWERREDALAVGEVADFLPAGRVETRWQRLLLPLDRLPVRLDPSTLASLVLEAAAPDSGRVYVSTLAFSLEPEPLPPLPGPAPSAAAAGFGKATWIWHTAELLEDAERRTALLDFLVERGFDRVFLQLPARSVAAQSPLALPPGAPPPDSALDVDPRLRPLLEELNAARIRVYALDGFAGYALPEYHPRVLRTIDNVARYNRDVRPDERFYGVRHDIEPYLLPGFNDGRRDAILRSYLALVAASAERARAAGLAYGVDIPFWYDAPDQYTYEPVSVEFRRIEKPVSEHLIDLADDVAIMDYRTEAFGADGTIRHAEGELAYAAAQGKRVFIGLETSPLPDEQLIEFAGSPRRGLPRHTPAAGLVVLAAAGDSSRVFVVMAGPGPERARRLAALSRRLRAQGTDPHDALWWPVRRRTDVPGDKLSFSRPGAEALHRVMEETAGELARYSSFAGFALHDARSYRALLERH